MAWRCDRLIYRLMHFVVESASQISLKPTSNFRKQLSIN